MSAKEDLFSNNNIFVLQYTDSHDWIECKASDLLAIQDKEDLGAAIRIVLDTYGYTIRKNEFPIIDEMEDGNFKIRIPFEENLFPERTGDLEVKLFKVRNAKMQ